MTTDSQWTKFVRSWRAIGAEAVDGWKWSAQRLAQLIAAHPLPWHIERDWTFEVTARDNTCVEKFSNHADAYMFIECAEEVAFGNWVGYLVQASIPEKK